MIGRHPPAPTTPAPPRCEACHATDTPTEHRVVAGIEMRLCANPTACRARALAAGIWAGST